MRGRGGGVEESRSPARPGPVPSKSEYLPPLQAARWRAALLGSKLAFATGTAGVPPASPSGPKANRGPRPRAGAASRRRRRAVAARRARHLAVAAATCGGRRRRARPACVCGGDGPGRPVRVSRRRRRGRGGAGGCAGSAGRGLVWGDGARVAAAACRGGWDLSTAAREFLQWLVPRGERRRRPSCPPPASCPRPRCSPRPRNGPFTRRAAADPARQSAPLHLA